MQEVQYSDQIILLQVSIVTNLFLHNGISCDLFPTGQVITDLYYLHISIFLKDYLKEIHAYQRFMMEAFDHFMEFAVKELGYHLFIFIHFSSNLFPFFVLITCLLLHRNTYSRFSIGL